MSTFSRSARTGAAVAVVAAMTLTSCSSGDDEEQSGPLQLSEQGSFAVGGAVRTEAGDFDPLDPADPQGQTYHGDHAYVNYQVPENARELPVVMLHGAGQFSKTWETTADGRDGFRDLFLDRDYSTYLVDQPRRGGAGRSMVEGEVSPTPDEQMWFNQFRLGTWPDLFPDVQFSDDPEAMEQFFRQMTPDTGPYDADVISDAMAELFDQTGEGVLFTHSQGGGPGWLTAIKNPNVAGIASFEPGSGFVFPEDELPEPIENNFDTVEGEPIPMDDFMALTEIPIVIYYGDNIPDDPVDMPAQDSWRARLEMARAWADTVNRHGGDATVVHLPETGINGNTHFPFSDLNNDEIADITAEWMSEKGLDRR
ncbi:alpha/beta hydrolase [Corynebacterium glyciniphilum]|uniref:alpha/beta hydrolase n=1 Tax=Corynebacterium glyciniphilum TaxID=1404244 RepID=UPI003DA02893